MAGSIFYGIKISPQTIRKPVSSSIFMRSAFYSQWSMSSAFSENKISRKLPTMLYISCTTGYSSKFLPQIFFQNIEHIESLKVYIIKLPSESGYSYEIESLLFALDFLERNMLCDLLVISSGVRIYNNLLYGKLSRLHERGTIIFILLHK